MRDNLTRLKILEANADGSADTGKHHPRALFVVLVLHVSEKAFSFPQASNTLCTKYTAHFATSFQSTIRYLVLPEIMLGSIQSSVGGVRQGQPKPKVESPD